MTEKKIDVVKCCTLGGIVVSDVADGVPHHLLVVYGGP